jgi:hypothetical protein
MGVGSSFLLPAAWSKSYCAFIKRADEVAGTSGSSRHGITKSRRGIMIPRAFFWPLMGIFLVMFIVDRCT